MVTDTSDVIKQQQKNVNIIYIQLKMYKMYIYNIVLA